MKVLTIVGPTAVGKTTLAIDVAQRVKGEIVSADSRQVYHAMTIGTAQPTRTQRTLVPFHLMDFLDPDQVYSCGQFARDAESCISNILDRNQVPIVCGGTGLYIKALFEPLHVLPESDDEIKKMLEMEAADQGIEVLYTRLKKIDPEWAQRINPRDTQRIIRGLEVYELTGMPLSQMLNEDARTPRYEPRYVGLTIPRSILYERINERFDIMIEQGLLDEVQGLLDQGFDSDTNALRTIGYRELIAHLQGRLSLAQAIMQAKTRTRNFAKRQISWFKKLSPIQWYDVRDPGLIQHLVSDLSSVDQ